MDLGLVSINLEERKMEYAGANSPAYLVRNGEVTELKPDKRAIASFEPGEFRFNTQIVPWRMATWCIAHPTDTPTSSAGRKGANSCANGSAARSR